MAIHHDDRVERVQEPQKTEEPQEAREEETPSLQTVAELCGLVRAPLSGEWLFSKNYGWDRIREYTAPPSSGEGKLIHTYEPGSWIQLCSDASVQKIPSEPPQFGLTVAVKSFINDEKAYVNISRGKSLFVESYLKVEVRVCCC